MTKPLMFAIARTVIALPVTWTMIFNKPPKVDAACYTECHISCSGNECYATCEQNGGWGSNQCIEEQQGDPGAYCNFIDSGCFD